MAGGLASSTGSTISFVANGDGIGFPISGEGDGESTNGEGGGGCAGLGETGIKIGSAGCGTTMVSSIGINGELSTPGWTSYSYSIGMIVGLPPS